MDCLEFRRRLGAEPQSRDPEFLAHRDRCSAGCSESWWRARRFEQRLEGALQSVDASPDLAERVLLVQATSSRGHARRGRKLGLALAASVLLALVAGGYAWHSIASSNGGALAGMAIAHVSTEAYSLTMTRPIGAQALQPLFTELGLTMRGAPAHAVFAADCRVGPYKAVHLVLMEHGGPVTALYVVDHRIAAAHDFERSGWRGREMPMGNGTLVLLGAGTEGFATAERTVAHAVLGTT